MMFATLLFAATVCNLAAVEGLQGTETQGRNLCVNPSFERGLHGWGVTFPGCPGEFDSDKHGKSFISVDETEARFGHRSLRLYAPTVEYEDDLRRLWCVPNLGSQPVFVPPGRYVVSFWAKAVGSGRPRLNMWFPGFVSGRLHSEKWRDKTLRFSCWPVADAWTRYEKVVDIRENDLLWAEINAGCKSGDGWIWIDGFQIERDEKATDFAVPVAEGVLLTGSSDNVIEASEWKGVSLRLAAAPNVSGTVVVSTRDFAGNERVREKLRFETDGKGETVVPQTLSGASAWRGLFVQRREYRMDDGTTAAEYDRFALIDSAPERFRWQRIFANTYSDDAARWNLPQVFARYRRFGLRNAYTVSLDPAQRKVFTDAGVDPGAGQMVQKNPDGWGVFDTIRTYYPTWIRPADRKVYIRNHKAEGVPLDEAYLSRFAEACAAKAAAHPDVMRWEFANEFFSSARVGIDWWSPSRDPNEAAAVYARYLKAFYAGVKRVNPQAVVMQDAPNNMSERGLEETERNISACAKIGLRFDAVAGHTYRASPEVPDLDATIGRLFSILRANGYPDSTPVHFGEGMHWGPYEIPEWGLKSASWTGVPTTWIAGKTLSYDIGRTERRSAAWRARSWLVGLKHAPRVLQMNSGNTNNFELDAAGTPRVSALVALPLIHLLGNATFLEDIRFAPHVRALLFKDEAGRPVVAVWTSKRAVDFGEESAPLARVDFGGDAVEVFDMLGGRLDDGAKDGQIVVSGEPRYYRGAVGAAEAFARAFRGARLQGGSLSETCRVAVCPQSRRKTRVTLTDYMTGNATNYVVTHEPLMARHYTSVSLPKEGVEFSAALMNRAPDDASLETIVWTNFPAIRLTNRLHVPTPGFSASLRTAWNASGLFLSVDVRDSVFSYVERKTPMQGYDNDCVQIYVDALGDAQTSDCPDRPGDDDYEYWLLPDATGVTCRVFRVRQADRQLALGTSDRPDRSFDPEIPARLVKTTDGYAYRVFFPDWSLLPASLRAGASLGIGVTVNDGNAGRKGSLVNSAVSGVEPHGHPKSYPLYLLNEK